MKIYPQIISKVYEQPWLITPAKHRAIRKLIETRLDGGITEPEGGDDDEIGLAMDGSTAIIPVHGIIGKHLSMLETMCGGCDLDKIGNMIDAAMADSNVRRILFDFRSPGGTVTGVPEMARKIKNISGKETAAFTDSMCCSGALWLAMSCGSFYCTESSDVGSVGVYSVYLDESVALEKEGVKVNAISAGKYKLAGASFQPMSADERKMIQDGVDKIYAQFKAAVTRNRAIPDDCLQGQVFDGEDAVRFGFCDGLVESISEILD